MFYLLMSVGSSLAPLASVLNLAMNMHEVWADEVSEGAPKGRNICLAVDFK